MRASNKYSANPIDYSDDPSAVDAFLMKRYNHGLFEFTRCMADLVYENYYYSLSKQYSLTLDQVKKRVDHVKHNIERILLKLEQSIYGHIVLDKDEPDLRRDLLIKQFHLLPFYKELDRQIMIADSRQQFAKRVRGRELKIRNYVLLLWSFYIVKKNGHVEWESLADLYQWHYEIIDTVIFKKELQNNNEIVNAQAIKREINRIKNILNRNPKLKKYFETRKRKYFPENDKKVRLSINIPEYFGKKLHIFIGEVSPSSERPSKRIIYSKEKYLI